MNRVLTSSARTGTGRDDWCTPSSILERVRQHGPISLDPCSGAGSVVEARVAFTKRQNGLVQDWAARVSTDDVAFVNPPYSHLLDWMQKAAVEAPRIRLASGQLCVFIAARTDTVAWHTIAPLTDAICFIKGRVKFLMRGAEQDAAPFPSALLYVGPYPAKFRRVCADLGHVVVSAGGDRG